MTVRVRWSAFRPRSAVSKMKSDSGVRHQHVGWSTRHLLTLPRGRVAGPQPGADGGQREPLLRGQRPDFGQRSVEIFLDVVA